MNLTPRLVGSTIHATVPHWTGGFGRPVRKGAEAMRRTVRGFFYASRFLVGGVLGGREACRFLFPVDQPITSSAAHCLVALVDGLKTEEKEAFMPSIAKNSSISISNIAIRQDLEGRYCLNDLYKASGSNPKHKPSEWLRIKQAKELIVEIENDKAGIPALLSIKGTRTPGTYVVKELVYAYAMWISPKFHLQVIRAYDALQQKPDNTAQLLKQARAEADNFKSHFERLADEKLHALPIQLLPLSSGSNKQWLVTQLAGESLTIQGLEEGAFTATSGNLARLIADDGQLITIQDLPAIIEAAAKRLNAAQRQQRKA